MKQNERIRQTLLALPPLSRIKLRASGGVYLVTLLRVIEATGSVEILWDGNTKREFKWGSVMFGSGDSPNVIPKPAEVIPNAQCL